MHHHLLQTIRIIVACGASYALSLALGVTEAYWAVITAVVVTQPLLGDTLSASKDRVIGTVIGAAAGFAVLRAEQHGGSRRWLFWLAPIPLAFLTALRPNRRLACITIAVLVLVPATGPPYARPVDRVLKILLGTAVSVAVSGFIRWPAPRTSTNVEADSLSEG